MHLGGAACTAQHRGGVVHTMVQLIQWWCYTYHVGAAHLGIARTSGVVCSRRFLAEEVEFFLV